MRLIAVQFADYFLKRMLFSALLIATVVALSVGAGGKMMPSAVERHGNTCRPQHTLLL